MRNPTYQRKRNVKESSWIRNAIKNQLLPGVPLEDAFPNCINTATGTGDDCDCQVISDDSGRFDDSFHLHMADMEYCLPPLKIAKRIMKKCKVNQRIWDYEEKEFEKKEFTGTFDCDDFALVLKAAFSQEAYERGAHGPYCFGIVWGMLPYPLPHALNWMINDDEKLRFVEPITNRVIRNKGTNWDRFKLIHLMLV